jgi:hypothetical protein
LLPLWVVLWHNAVGFLWLTWMGCGREGDDLRIRQHHELDQYQLGSLVCALIFDNVLRKMGGPGDLIGGGWHRAPDGGHSAVRCRNVDMLVSVLDGNCPKK